jgi:hypothetical protein
MDRVKEAVDKKTIPENIFQLILKRYPIVDDGIQRIERATGINYPIFYVDPKVVITSFEYNHDNFGIFFARTIPVVNESYGLNIVIQISGALIAYGFKGTIHAVLGHEFLHYIELLNRVRKMEILSDELSSNLFENTYTDNERTIEPHIVFKKDKTLVHHIRRRFNEGFQDNRLAVKVMKDWIDKGLPTTRIDLNRNYMKIPIEQLSNFRLGNTLNSIMDEYEKNSQRYKRRIFKASNK